MVNTERNDIQNEAYKIIYWNKGGKQNFYSHYLKICFINIKYINQQFMNM